MIATDVPSQAINFSIRMNKQLKTDSELLYRSLGLSLSSAIQVFLKQSLISGGIPFQVRMPNYNAETLAAMRESNKLAHDSNARTYSVDEAFEELDK